MRGILVALAVALAAAPSAQAAFWTPPKPKKSDVSHKWIDYGCTIGRDGNYHAHATIDTYVYKLHKKTGMFRQKVKVQIDRQAGYAGTDWRQVSGASRAGTKGDAGWIIPDSSTRDGTPVPGTPLPDGIRMSVSTGMQPDVGTLTAKATVWLKRNAWPKAVWRYKVRSPEFTCNGGLLPTSPQNPVVNGGM
jgi:hypothetical protein